MANAWYNEAKLRLGNQTLDLVTDTIGILLIQSSYTFDPDHQFVSEVSASECNATNYTGGHLGSGRRVLSTGKAWAKDLVNDRAEFDADDPSVWNTLGNGTNNQVNLVVYRQGTVDDTDALLIAYIDTNTGGPPNLPYQTNGSNLTIVINAEGLLQLV